MSWLKKLIKKISNIFSGHTTDQGVKSTKSQPVPSPAPAAGSGNLQSDIRGAVERSFSERNQGEIDANRVLTAAPLPSRLFCDGIADSYDRWYRTLHAGIMSPEPSGIVALKSGLRSFEFATWGLEFAAYWQTTVWKPIGVYTGGITTNAAAMGSALQGDINRLLLVEKPRTMVAFADRITTILTTYTTQLLVQATLSVAPNTKVEKVM